MRMRPGLFFVLLITARGVFRSDVLRREQADEVVGGNLCALVSSWGSLLRLQ